MAETIQSESRQTALQAFATVLSQEKNCLKFEKYIFDYTTKNEGDLNMYFWYVYQAIGLILQDMKMAAREVKEGKLGWKSSTFEKISGKIAEYDEYLVHPFEVVEGVTECGKCGSRRTWNVQRQVRCNDEPMTTFSRCVECGNQWTYSG